MTRPLTRAELRAEARRLLRSQLTPEDLAGAPDVLPSAVAFVTDKGPHDASCEAFAALALPRPAQPSLMDRRVRITSAVAFAICRVELLDQPEHRIPLEKAAAVVSESYWQVSGGA